MLASCIACWRRFCTNYCYNNLQVILIPNWVAKHCGLKHCDDMLFCLQTAMMQQAASSCKLHEFITSDDNQHWLSWTGLWSMIRMIVLNRSFPEWRGIPRLAVLVCIFDFPTSRCIIRPPTGHAWQESCTWGPWFHHVSQRPSAWILMKSCEGQLLQRGSVGIDMCVQAACKMFSDWSEAYKKWSAGTAVITLSTRAACVEQLIS